MLPFVLLSRLVGVGWETAGQACEYLQVPLTEPFFDLLGAHGWLRVVLIGSFVELLVVGQHAFAERLFGFSIGVLVVDEQAVFLVVRASLENLVCDVQ